MPTIGVCVITKNEAQTIRRCLDSIPFATQKIVVDSGSTDETVELAQKSGAQVIFRKWTGYADQKQFALDQMTTDWVIPIDGDEWLSPEVAKEILEKIESDDKSCNAYRIVGRNVFMGKVLTKGKGLDHSIRLVRRGYGVYDKRIIHETMQITGNIGCLKHHLYHLSTPTIKERLIKIIEHTDDEMSYLPSTSIGFKEIIVEPIRYFLGYFIKSQTWKDGIEGIIWLFLFSFQNFYRNARFYEKQKAKYTEFR